MNLDTSTLRQPRVVFLLVQAVVFTLLFFLVIRDFLLVLLLAAVLAGLAHPFYRRMVAWLGGRKRIASGVTVVLSLLLVVIPVLLFMSILLSEAISVSRAATEWVAENSEGLQGRIEEDPGFQRLLPYQEEITGKAGEVAARAGSIVASGLGDLVSATAGHLLLLFVMLYAMFFFLTDGRAILDAVLLRTPLSDDDRDHLLGTYVSVARATLKGTLVIGIVQGTLAGLAFWMAGVKGAVFWGTLVTVVSIVPGVGTVLVWLPMVIFLALNGQAGAAVGVGLWCALVVGPSGDILRPVLVGKDTKMPDLLVMLTTFGGLALFGAPGILIGPIVGALFLTGWRMWDRAAVDAGDGANAPR